MANGYIGKISAIVTASTADLERKLRGAKGEVEKFGRSLNSTIASASRSAESSLNGIFTPLQKLERALRADRGSRLRVLDPREISRIQKTAQVAEDLNKPLTAATRQFSALSREIAAQFAPALRRAQDEVLAINESLRTGGTFYSRSFVDATRAIDRTTESLRRLSQAQQLAVSGFSGNELQFTSPRAFQALQSAAASTSRAAELPASALADGSIQRQVQRLQQFRNLIAQTVAEVEEIRLRPNVDQTALAAAERRLDNIVETTLRAKAELDRAVRPESRGFVARDVAAPARGLGLFGSQAGTDAEAAIEQARRVSAQYAKLPEAAKAGVSGLAGIAARLSDQVQATGNNAEQLLLVLQRLERQIEATQQPPSQNTGLALYTPPVDIAATGADLVSGFDKLKRDRESAARTAIGRDIGDPIRQVDSLEGRIGSLKGRIDSLPASVQSQFIPAVRRLQDEFVRLRVVGPAATAEDIERTASEVDNLASRVEQASRFTEEFATTLRNASGTRAFASLQGLRSVLSDIGIAAGTDAANAFERLRIKTQEAAAASDYSPQTRKEIRLLEAEVLRLASAYTGLTEAEIKAKQAAAAIRFGDVGRGGADRASLAFQQLAFAIDDFFSVTGGLDQRVRAIGNNITQLGFIVGGTTGLWVTLAAVIGTQALVALSKFVFKTEEADAALKELNNALEQSKRNAEELARAYENLANAVAKLSLDSQQSGGRERARLLKDIEDARQARGRELVASRSPEVAEERGRQAILKKQLEETKSIEERLRIQREIEASRKREQAAAANAANPALNRENDALLDRAGQLNVDARRVQRNRADAGRLNRLIGLPVFGEFDPQQLRQREQELQVATQARRRRLADEADRNAAQVLALRDRFGIGQGTYQETSRQLRARGLRGEADMVDQVSARQGEIRSLLGIQSGGEDFWRDIADIRGGPRDATGGIQAEIAALADARAELQATLDALRADNQLPGRERGRAEDPATQRVDAIAQTIDELDAQLQSLNEVLAAEIAGRIAPTLLDVGLTLESSLARLREAELESTGIARQRNAVAEQLQAIADELATVTDPARAAALEQQAGQLREQAASLDSSIASIVTFSETLKRVSSELSDTVATEARQQAAQARRDANAAEAGAAGRGQAGRDEADAAARRRERLEQQARQAEDRNREIQAENRRAVARFEEDARAGNLGQDAQQLINQRDTAQAIIDGRIMASDRERQEAFAVRDDANARLARRFEDSPEGRAARDAADAADRDLQANAQREEDIRRGRELRETPAAQAGRELADSLRQLETSFDQDVAEGVLNRRDAEAQLAEASRRQIDDAFRSQAPAIAGLADSVANAVLQGPSRAALNATDVSTVEGARELNRLIRGDDAARDQNLEELRRQSGKLDELIQAVKDNGGDVAN